MITIDRVVGDGKYSELLDVCKFLADTYYGSGTNALFVLATQSKLFKDTRDNLRAAASKAKTVK